MRALVLLLLCFPAAVISQALDPLPQRAVAQAASTPPIPPAPAFGWVLDQSAQTIPAVFGSASLTGIGLGSLPTQAPDGAGNIDGPALLGQNASNPLVQSYALQDPTQASLAAGTTVFLLCGRQDYWLTGLFGGQLPVQEGGQWNAQKPGEWGLRLVSSLGVFAVTNNGSSVYAKSPAPPANFLPFSGSSAYPVPFSNAPVCLWAFYDTSVHGTTSAPQISTAYGDGPASAAVVLNESATATHALIHNAVASSSPMQVNFGKLGADLGTLFIWQGASAERLFQQSVRAAYWNGGLRSSVASGFQTPVWSGLSATALNPQPIALGGDAQDNVWANAYASFVRTTAFAHYSITSSPGTPFVAVRYQLGNSPQAANAYSVSFLLDGQYLGYDQPWRDGTIYRTIPLPQDGNSHTLDLRNGFARGNGNYAAPTTATFGGGGFIDAVAVPSGYTVQINHPVPTSVALVLSHSVAVADEAPSAPYQDQGAQSSVAWPVLARSAGAFGTASAVDESFAGQLMANNCWTQAACNTYIAKIKAAQPNITVGFVAQLLNDFFHGPAAYNECLPQYERTMQHLFIAWSAQFPGVPLYVGSDTLTSAALEATADGCSPALYLSDWRAGIQSTVQSYAAAHNATWLQFVDMTSWVPQSQLVPSGLHPTVQGQIGICQQVAALFNQSVTCGVPR
jgi:hypothetical protein